MGAPKKDKFPPRKGRSQSFYASDFKGGYTEGMFLLHFEWDGPFDAEPSGIDVIVPPLLAKALLKVMLPDLVQEYEKEFGRIKLPKIEKKSAKVKA